MRLSLSLKGSAHPLPGIARHEQVTLASAQAPTTDFRKQRVLPPPRHLILLPESLLYNQAKIAPAM